MAFLDVYKAHLATHVYRISVADMLRFFASSAYGFVTRKAMALPCNLTPLLAVPACPENTEPTPANDASMDVTFFG